MRDGWCVDVWNSRADSNCMSRMKGAALTDFPRSVCLCVCVSACVSACMRACVCLCLHACVCLFFSLSAQQNFCGDQKFTGQNNVLSNLQRLPHNVQDLEKCVELGHSQYRPLLFLTGWKHNRGNHLLRVTSCGATPGTKFCTSRNETKAALFFLYLCNVLCKLLF